MTSWKTTVPLLLVSVFFASAITWVFVADRQVRSDEDYERQEPAVDMSTVGIHGMHDGEHAPGDHGPEEYLLFFAPGGIYTREDIERNGTVPPSQKYARIASKHDFRPKPGDAICPITMTKADSRFVWIIAGKEYIFCCPPCIEEFVRMAKEEPESVKDPGEYYKE